MSPFSLKVESLRAQVAQKDMFISDLLDRIAIVECEVGWGCCDGVVWLHACTHAYWTGLLSAFCIIFLCPYACADEVTSVLCMCLT